MVRNYKFGAFHKIKIVQKLGTSINPVTLINKVIVQGKANDHTNYGSGTGNIVAKRVIMSLGADTGSQKDIDVHDNSFWSKWLGGKNGANLGSKKRAWANSNQSKWLSHRVHGFSR